MRGLYLHIPFCAQKCGYCNFVITLDRRDDFRARFFKALENEMIQANRQYGSLDFDTVYLGGGTPSLLSAGEMRAVIEQIRRYFKIKPAAEFTCEFNPGDADRGKIDAFRDLGINRVSLGVQAFQGALIQKARRLHSVEDTYETVHQLKAAGLSNLSFDLISGLPGQTVKEFRQSLQETVRLEAKQLSFYDLEIHENTPWGIERAKGGLKLLDEDERAEFFQSAVDLMTGAGYEQYEISTFARPGFESKHNLIYWNNGEYLGLGPGAYSYLNGIRSQFAPDMGRYLFKCAEGDWKPDAADLLTDEEKETETFITGLRLSAGVDLEDFPILKERLEPRIRELILSNLLAVQGTRIVLTAQGRALVETAFSFLIKKD